MSDQTIRAAIKARLAAMGPGIGRVHDYERMAVTVKEFIDLFQDPTTKKLFGWEITRRSFRVQKVAMGKWKVVHRYMIRGYYGLNDAAGTEKVINALADTIILNFTRQRIAGTQGDQLPEGKVEQWMFGNVLCHRAEIELPEVAEIVEQLPEDGETDLLAVGLDYYLKAGDDVVDASDEITLSGP
ncbi:hypothetical protein DSOUD_0867 [Desulfuromonas soudanensis]|uniref:Uncharacterized protein n=1 Tax=Desulfuromonas soudanensis TaxID=1603606 RepID=A0A0M4CVD7_9BACT|nr:hypothetical protein [Desulfuromonas soudanensis]ALC15654.1 hypothetical protein DSOUD_0867 [Desulfuromonas soudanensis]